MHSGIPDGTLNSSTLKQQTILLAPRSLHLCRRLCRAAAVYAAGS